MGARERLRAAFVARQAAKAGIRPPAPPDDGVPRFKYIDPITGNRMPKPLHVREKERLEAIGAFERFEDRDEELLGDKELMKRLSRWFDAERELENARAIAGQEAIRKSYVPAASAEEALGRLAKGEPLSGDDRAKYRREITRDARAREMERDGRQLVEQAKDSE